MPVRRKGNKLELWEVALVKAMLMRGGYNDQDILAFFTRPTRSINHRAIAEIRSEQKHKIVNTATPEELDAFLATWPDVDPQSGLSMRGDELLGRTSFFGETQTVDFARISRRSRVCYWVRSGLIPSRAKALVWSGVGRA